MTNDGIDQAQILRMCRGNEEAYQWIQLGRRYVHEIDDLLDNDVPKADRFSATERVSRIGILAIELYTHPFFVKHSQALGAAMVSITNSYTDSVHWEKSGTKWKANFSDWARHGWIDVCLLVAYICGGHQNMRNESAELRAIAFADHHDEHGQPS